MKNLVISRILNSEQLDFMKDKLETILAERGVKVEHPEVLQLVKEAGAEVSDLNVRFPRKLIKETLEKKPDSFTLAGRDKQYDLKFPHPDGLFYTRTCTGALNYYNENNEYHPITLREAGEFTRLTSHLEHVDFCSIPSTQSKDVPPETLDIHTLRTVMENTSKHIWIQPYEKENVKYLIEIAAAVAGGKEKLKARPIISMIACSNTPLEYKSMDLEVILQCCKSGVPIQACALPTGGANAPVTSQGYALMAATEVMAMVLLAQLIKPGTPVIATPLLFSMDMSTTYTLQSPIEVTMGRMVAMQLFTEGYGLPAHTYGTGSDSIVLDGQNMIERTSITHMVALSGASVLGGAGQLEVAKTISPLQLIIDNDIFGMVKQLKAGLEISNETLAFDEIKRLKGREAFIAMDHTYRHFRDIFMPQTFFRDTRRSWEEHGSKDLVERSRDIYVTLQQKYQNFSLPENVSKEIEDIIQRADHELKGVRRS